MREGEERDVWAEPGGSKAWLRNGCSICCAFLYIVATSVRISCRSLPAADAEHGYPHSYSLALALTVAFSVPFHHSFIPSSRSHRVCHAVTVSLRAPNMAAVALRLLLFLSVTQLPLSSLGCFLAFPASACCVSC